MDEQLFGIAAFRSRQQVMRFESTLRRAGIGARVISTPKDVAIGCGLSVQFDLRDLRQVQSYLSGGRPARGRAAQAYRLVLPVGLFQVKSCRKSSKPLETLGGALYNKVKTLIG